MAEGRRLQRIGRTAKDQVKLRRAIVVLMSAQGQSVSDIAHLLDCSAEYVRGVIHDFNDTGFGPWTQNGAGAGRGRSVTWCLAKMHRVLDLYDNPPEDGRVICADEFGPPAAPGARAAASPAAATYRRTGGVRHMIAALDLATGQITYRIRTGKRWRELLSFLKLLRARWPGQKLYVIMGNF